MKCDFSARRRVLQGGLAAGSLFLPTPWAWVWAQSEGATKLLRAPKVALVVGNGAYRAIGTLKNPANDATDVAAALRASGFETTLLLNASRREMLAAIEAHAQGVAARKAVGVFYFAGHGAQLDWRNYLLPVEAKVTERADVAAQCVDLSILVAGVRKAANPMNLIVLDACRDDPFGSATRMEQKGLSQMDAPPGTMLAYSTAPGNTAADGPGANGLYTENLLREMKVREARIEDVFKRVRLAVRRASGGQQIPWESTSLEEDFYFLPPEQLRKLSVQEEEREFAVELAAFEAVSRSVDPATIEAYLRRYPSGRFAELAQLRLDQVLATGGEKPVAAVSSKDNPFTVGTGRTDTKYRVGDRYTYDRIDRLPFGNKPNRFTIRVTAITGEHVIFGNGIVIRDLLGNQLRFRDGRETTPRQDTPLEYAVGKKWSTRFNVSKAGQSLGTTSVDFRVAGREKVSVPAGTFDCFRIEGRGTNRDAGAPEMEIVSTRWDAPDRVRSAVARDEVLRRVVRGHVTTERSNRLELVSFEQS